MPEQCHQAPGRLAALWVAVLVVAPPAHARPAGGPLRIVYGGDESFFPYEYRGDEGSSQGFNVELMRLLAEDAGFELELRLGPWSEVRDAFDRGAVDVMSLAWSAERAERYDFVTQTWTLHQSFIFQPGRDRYPTALEELAGEVIAVEERGATHELLLRLPPSRRPRLVPVKSQSMAIEALLDGRATSTGGNRLVLRHGLTREGWTELVDVQFASWGYHLATQKGRGAELAELGERFRRLVVSDRFHDIVERTLVPPPRPSGWRDRAGLLAAAVAVLALGATAIAGWNRVLARGVTRRTGELGEITARLRREQAARERFIAELETRNAEMERFSYTVSHDLKSPLVTIRAFAGLARRDAAEGNREAVADHTRRIESAADHMRELLDQMLELSKVGRVIADPEDVDLRELAREATELLAAPIVESGAAVGVADDLPVVRGDRRRLVEVFQNLIGNAIKFMGRQPEPRIEIGARSSGDEHVFYVRDNGQGVPARYQERIFDLFERLESDVPGTGVGLALVQRIVETHGGTIWVESEGEGRGSAFCFTLPSPREPSDPVAAPARSG